ncbi:MAG: HNH endonuclease [Clostridiales bacterium]|nr:HNH endonuclease [Clostridiales bacterium]
MFIFLLTRKQTRYSQRNYVKTPYIVNVKVGKVECSLREVEERYKLLSEIGFQCTLNEYHSKDQRRLMTKELKDQIKKRDHYTCQVCRKYMPDEVGLHIDHIIPISKGGKSIPSNLQVLCSKCNGSKSNKC